MYLYILILFFFFWIWCVCLFVCLFVFFIIKRTNEKKKRTFHRMTAKIKENKGRWKSGTKKLFVSQKRRLCIPFQVCFFFFLSCFFSISYREKKKTEKEAHRAQVFDVRTRKWQSDSAYFSVQQHTHTHTHTQKKKAQQQQDVRVQ